MIEGSSRERIALHARQITKFEPKESVVLPPVFDLFPQVAPFRVVVRPLAGRRDDTFIAPFADHLHMSRCARRPAPPDTLFLAFSLRISVYMQTTAQINRWKAL